MLTFIIGALLGFAFGWYMLRVLINHKMKLMLDSIANSPEVETKLKVVDIELVKIKDRVYAYDRKDNSFLGYANTKIEMIDDLRKRYPNTSFMARSSNLKEVEFNDTI